MAEAPATGGFFLAASADEIESAKAAMASNEINRVIIPSRRMANNVLLVEYILSPSVLKINVLVPAF